MYYLWYFQLDRDIWQWVRSNGNQRRKRQQRDDDGLII